MKLPKIDIQPFDWQSDLRSEFYNNFQCAVHQSLLLSDIQKVAYLKSLPIGYALSMISAFKLSNENYNAALNLLKERFDNKQLQIVIKMKNLLKISTVSDK